MIIMLITNMNDETCIDNTVTSINLEIINEASDKDKCTSILNTPTPADVVEINSISESIILSDDDIIILEEGAEKRSSGYEINSKKRKVGSQSPVEEIVFNYLTGIYDKVKRNKSEGGDQIQEETELSIDNTTLTNNDPESDQESQCSPQTDRSLTINCCKCCDFKTVSKQKFKFHLFRSHLSGKYSINYICKLCTFNTNAVTTMALHQIDHKMEEKIQDNATDIYLGDNVEIKIFSKDITLDMENFREIEWLESISHSVYGESVFKCFDCIYEAKRRDLLQNHVVHHENSNFTCNEHLSLQRGCLKCVYKCYLLMLPYKLIACRKCDFKTCRMSNYSRHDRLVHSTNSMNIEICKEEILSKKVMLTMEHREEIERLQSIKNYHSDYRCFDCEYVARKRESLQNHVIRHENSSFTCDEHLSLTSGCTKCVYKCCLLMLSYKLLKCNCGFKTCKNNNYLRHVMQKDCIGINKLNAQESTENEDLVDELQSSEHQNNISSCGNSQTITLSSDSSEGEESVD